MKCLFLLLALTLTSTAFAQQCSDNGAKVAEKAVREEIEMRFGAVKIEASTKSSVSNVYSRQLHCTHSTVFTFETTSPETGKFSRFVGLSVINEQGQRPMALEVSEVKDI